MSTYSGTATGRALARLGRLAGHKSERSAVTHESRDRVLALVEAAPEPLLVEQICDGTGLHANTVRGHLDTLVAAEKVARTPGPRIGRGRPPWLYSAVTSSAVAELHRSLRAQLEQADAGEVAHEAAAAWASSTHLGMGATDPDDAVRLATAALEDLGFSAEATPVGDAIVLRECPYASLVADNPVICDIHAGLLADIFGRADQGVTVSSLDVWARPGVCVAHLDRPDLPPARIITGDPLMAQPTKQQTRKRSATKKRQP